MLAGAMELPRLVLSDVNVEVIVNVVFGLQRYSDVVLMCWRMCYFVCVVMM